ncbi:MAG TPA: phosphoribosylanthranilate isomerase [Tepidisphaeraceae bacterium]|jgi:phosphoribosylanthranilate isomerase
MSRTRVKICGVCRPQDAAAAAQAGADAVGIIFDPTSRRYITPEDAIKIVAEIPPFVMPVGLFVNATPEDIRRIQSLVPLAAIQLQGDETPEFVAKLKPLRIIKTLHLSADDTATLNTWRTAIRDLQLTNIIGIMLETPSTGPARGGTGIANNFTGLAAMKSAGHFANLPPIIAAGGLNSSTVGDVVQLMRPFAVDVASGVESALREKSPQKIQAFIRAVRDADGV